MAREPPLLTLLIGTWFSLPEMRDVVIHHIMPFLRWQGPKYRVVREKKPLYRAVSHDLYIVAIDGAGRYLVTIRNSNDHIQAVGDGMSCVYPSPCDGYVPCNHTDHIDGLYLTAPPSERRWMTVCSRYSVDGDTPVKCAPRDDTNVKRYVESEYQKGHPMVKYGYMGGNRCYITYDCITAMVVYLFDTGTWKEIAAMFFERKNAVRMQIDVVISGGYIIVICEKAGLSGSAVDIRFYNMSGTLRKRYTCNVSGDVDIKVYPGRAKVAIISYEWNIEWTKLTRDAKHVTVRTVELVTVNRHHTYG